MNTLLETTFFAILTLSIIIIGAYFSSTYFDLAPYHAVAAIIGWFGLVYRFHNDRANKDSSETTNDDSSANNQHDEELTNHEEEPSQPESTPENELAADQSPGTEHEDVAETPTARPSSSLLRSNEEIIAEVEDKLDYYVEFSEDGTVTFDNYDDLSLYSQMTLQVIVKRLKYEYQTVGTPEIAVEEIREAVGKNRAEENSYKHNEIEVMLFLDVARNWLTPSYRTTDIDCSELDETTVTVDLKHLSEAVDWILNDQQDHVDLPTDLGLAAAALNDARDRYEKLVEKEDTRYYPGSHENYDPVREHVLSACDHVKRYPVVVEYRRELEEVYQSCESPIRSS